MCSSRKRGSSVAIVTRLRAGHQGNRGSFPVIFILLYSVYTASVGNLTSYATRTEGSVSGCLRVNRPGHEANHAPPSIAKFKNI